MPPKERVRDRGRRHAQRLRTEIAEELRVARLAAGLTQSHVARSTGLSQSAISRAERGQQQAFTFEGLATHLTVLGLRLSIKAYPEGSPVRDAGQLALLRSFLSIVSSRYRQQLEAPIGGTGDLRAWDVRLTGPARIGIDAETRLFDIQAVLRRIEVKGRDDQVDRVVLVVLDSRWNRRVLTDHASLIRTSLPLDTAAMRAALEAGRDPGANGLILRTRSRPAPRR